MTQFVPAMWSVWGGTVLVLFALKMYMMRLTRDEDAQIVLDESFDHVRVAQAALVAKVDKIEPLERIAVWLTGATTMFVIVYYVRDIALNLHLLG
jgi:hypothetical protein